MKKKDFTEDIIYQWEKVWSNQNIQHVLESCEKDTFLRPYFFKYLSKDGVILEAGCGLGQWVVYLSRLGYNIIGIEIVPNCVKVCKTYFHDVDIRIGDVRNLPFPDKYFDGYISLGVIEHMIEGPESTLQEMKRVLKPNGIAIITVPAYNYFLKIWYPLRKFIVEIFRKNKFFRKILGKPKLLYDKFEGYKKLIDIKKRLKPRLWPIIGIDPVKGPIFLEYRYEKGYLEHILKSFGFKIIESVPIYHPFIFQDIFGNLFFKNNLQLNIFGKIIEKIFNKISPHFFNFYYLYVVKTIK
ncbi:MAG: class I SAM-dependent methyltransferase [Endomicrobiia bacterium]